MPIFYRYLFKEITSLFLAIVLLLNAILLSFRLSHILTRALKGHVSLSAVWQLLEYQGIKFLTILIPLSFIIASLMTLARMYRDHEIIALLSAGINQNSIKKAISILALIISCCLLIITLFILPIFSQHKDAVISQAKQEAGYALLDSNSFRQLDDDTIIYVGKQNNALFEDFVVFQKDDQGLVNSMIHSNTAGFTKNNKLLTLNQGIRINWDPQTFAVDKFNYTHFSEAKLTPPEDNDTTNKTQSIPTFLLTSNKAEQAELQNRLNPSIALLIFSLLIPIIAYTKPRKQGRFQTLIPAFILFALYINILDYVTKAITANKIALYPGSYLVHAIVLASILSVWLLTRKRI